MNARFEQPDGLGEHGRWLWDLYISENGDWMRGTDGVLLAQACHFADLLPILHEKAAETGTSGSLVALGVASDKFLALSARLGMTRADRLKLKLESPKSDKPKEVAPKRPKTKLGELTPDKLGITIPE